MFQLMILDSRGGQSRRVALVEGATVSFGSSVDCELVLPGGEVAPHHGTFEPGETGWRFVASGSKTSALVNGEKVQSAELKAGDVVTVGPFRLVLTPAPGGAARAAAPHAPAPPAPIDEPPPPAPSRHIRHHTPGASRSDERHALAIEGKTHSKRGMANQKSEGTKTVLIVVGIMVVGFSVYFFGSGNPWGDLDDKMRVEALDVRKKLSACDFDGASRKVNELMALATDSSAKNKVIDLQIEVDKSRAGFDKGRTDFEALRNSGLDPRTLQDKLKMFAYENRAYPPLANAADELWTNINAQLRAAAAAPRAPPPKKAPEPEEE